MGIEMKIEIQRTDWMEFVYNKIKASEEGIFGFKIRTEHKLENSALEWRGDSVTSDIYLRWCKTNGVKDRETTIKNIKVISNILERFVDNVTPLFLDSITSLSYTDEQAKEYIENVQKIKSWYDKGLFGEVVSNVPVGAPLPQANYL